MGRVRESGPVFHEEQRFRQRWLWALVLPVSAMSVFGAVVIVLGMVQQLGGGEPWGDRPMSDEALVWIGPLLIVICVVTGAAVPWVLYALRMITEVTSVGVHVRFAPLTRRLIGFDRIASCEARTYRPILEYGGWGIRWGLKGSAYNVSGNQGVQLVLIGGKRLLIGSQRADELAEAICQGKQGKC